MTILTLDWQGQGIKAAETATVLSGYDIPQGYVNATHMCQAHNKEWSDYARLQLSKELAVALSDKYQIPVQIRDDSFSSTADLPLTDGNHKKALIINLIAVPNNLKGIWVHSQIAIDLAMWISMPFRLWAVEQIERLLHPYKDDDHESPLETRKKVPSYDAKHAADLARTLKDLIYVQRSKIFHPNLQQDLFDNTLIAYGIDPDDPRYASTTESNEISDCGYPSLLKWVQERIDVTNDVSHRLIKEEAYVDYQQFSVNNDENVLSVRVWGRYVRRILIQAGWKPTDRDYKFQGQRCFKGLKLK